MNLLLNIKNYKKGNIFFEERKKNNALSECYFIGIQYSNNIYNLTNLMVQMTLKGKIKINVIDNILSITYDETTYNQNTSIFKQLMHIEEQLLLLYKKHYHKDIQLNLHNLFMKRYIRICTEPPISQTHTTLHNKIVDQLNLAFRISGLWENNTGTVGIIYKFINIDPVLNIVDIYDHSSNYESVDNVYYMHKVYPSVRSNNSFLT